MRQKAGINSIQASQLQLSKQCGSNKNKIKQGKQPGVPDATRGSSGKTEEEVKKLQTPARGSKMLHKHNTVVVKKKTYNVAKTI